MKRKIHLEGLVAELNFKIKILEGRNETLEREKQAFLAENQRINEALAKLELKMAERDKELKKNIIELM